ncbi:NifB/NifX family molybdenum-iron cluster-binding protein [Haliovirga abyssi]|uniref:Dinitrogenase iron-molybdenum cofactor biosynthesis domain-containing protein n=1 Tax=Haliovirga abyssi TaxID=2996794 RepID=A0AAU9DKF2_9FUSO|nr:NifB/NifX family molybdenum-iron cluster-binding protein [Haliovirga abyssi]BDU50367.1 hypothetical protein HLVA_09360 [Haliovirga abyssi]
MNELIIACATNNGEEFVNDHFGSANYFDIYKMSKESIEKIDRVDNTSEEEKEDDGIHGDPNKAKGISGILKKKDVQVVVGYKMGPNIIRMKKKFVPVIVRNINIKNSLEIVKNNFDKIVEELNNGENRKHIVLE